MNVAQVREILDRAGIEFALIGAMAVALRGHARFTQDVDLFTTDRRVLQPATWDELVRRGESVDIRGGDFDDPLAGVVRIGSPRDQVDIVVGKWKWEQGVIARAVRLDVFGATMLVPRRSDLILLKLAAGGYKDLVDAAGLLAAGPRNESIAEVEAQIGDLPRDAQLEWRKLIDATSR